MTNIVDLPKQSLAVTVWDHDKLKQNEYIGIDVWQRIKAPQKQTFSGIYFIGLKGS